MTKLPRLPALFLASSLLVACGGNQVVPEDQFYRLADMTPARVLSQPLLVGRLSVAPFRTSALYHDRALIYTNDNQPLQLRRHHYHHWVDAPPRLLQAELTRYLDRSGIADQVLVAGAAQPARYQVKGTLEQFEQLLSDRGNRVRVAMRLELLDQQTAQVLVSENYAVITDPVSGGRVYDSVESFQQAVDSIFARWLARLGELPRPVQVASDPAG